jgi:putative SOS response-associated peptidase YedK
MLFLQEQVSKEESKMCGRYVLSNPERLGERFGLTQSTLTLEPRFNVAPSQHMPVVLQDASGAVTVEALKWGLIPAWSKDGKPNYSMINARAEGIETKPAYRKPIRSQRCIVPSDGFYEWQKRQDGKLPHFIHLKSEEIFGFAGLYDIYRDKDGNETKTYSIITTVANELMEPIHDRMPVILRRDDEKLWLDRKITDLSVILPLLKPYPASQMEAYPVSTRVNKPVVDTPELIEAVA